MSSIPFEKKDLERKEVPLYLKRLGFTGEFIEDFTIMLENKKINLIRVRGGKPSGCDGFITNDLEFCMNKHKMPLIEWIYIKDSETALKPKQ